MAEGIIDVSSAGAHQRRFSFVVPAGSKERMGRRAVALLTLSKERLIL